MISKKKIGLLSLLFLLSILGTLPLQAQTIFVDRVNDLPGINKVTGQLTLIRPPTSVLQDDLASDTEAFVFIEKEDVGLSEPLKVNTVDTGTFNTVASLEMANLARNTRINSYFLHFDRTSQPAQLVGIQGSITFDQDILGLIVLSTELNNSTLDLKFAGTAYGIGHGLEFSAQAENSQDSVTVSNDRRTLTVDLQNNVQVDQIRIITRRTADDTGGGTDPNKPVINNDTATTREGTAVVINVLSNDTDPNNNLDRSSIKITDNADNGTTSIDTTDRTVTYTPNSNFRGTDSFKYEVCDTTTPTKLCDDATVTVTVTASGTPTGVVTILPAAKDCSKFAQATIDIVPGNRDNPIRLDDLEGMTPVAILATEEFPAPNCVDINTITFGKVGTEQKPISCGAINTNFDRWVDILCDFDTSKLGFKSGDVEGTLKAKTIKNDVIEKKGSVTVYEPRRFPGRMESLSVKTLSIGSNMLFVGQGKVAGMKLEVFSLVGQRVYESGFTSGSALRWNLRTTNGAKLANGVYFYVVTLKSQDGQLSRHLVKTVVILR